MRALRLLCLRGLALRGLCLRLARLGRLLRVGLLARLTGVAVAVLLLPRLLVALLRGERLGRELARGRRLTGIRLSGVRLARGRGHRLLAGGGRVGLLAGLAGLCGLTRVAWLLLGLLAGVAVAVLLARLGMWL
ncbi:hypothetical protein GTW59_39265, partial [Streptomyces sp. SID89]|nr:hypothetical protein [Streptomyces sp. SID89]